MLVPRRQRILLMIGDDGIVVAPDNIPAAPFFVSAEGKQAAAEIDSFIARYPKAKVILLADNLAQDYRHDAIPRLNFFDRAKLITRRLRQTFPAARLTASLPLRQSRDRRLMIGIHDSNPVFGWADYLRERLPTISLLPVEGARLAAKLMPEATTGWVMTISRQKTGGFRQIVTYKKDLIFTRLTPLPPVGADDAETLAHDIKASLDYLTRHGLQSPRDLTVMLLIPGDIHMSPAFAALPLHAALSLSPHAAARRLGLSVAPPENDPHADLLYAAHYLATRPVLSLMLPDMKQTQRTRDIRHWGLRVASVALGAALAVTIWRAGDVAATIYDIGKQTLALEQTRHTLAQLQANAAPVTEPLGRLRQALERRHIYEQPTAVPWPGLNELAAGLDDNTRLMRLSWKKENDTAPEIFSVGLSVTPTVAPPDRAETVAAFARTTQQIAAAMPDYTLSIDKPPYPDLPQEAVSAAGAGTDDPVGEITLQRKAP